MKSVGKQLQEARLAKGWSMEFAAHETKIRLDRLKELEEDEYSNFSSPTYARGFVRTYARALGLDEYHILRQLDNKPTEDDLADDAARPPAEKLLLPKLNIRATAEKCLSSMPVEWEAESAQKILAQVEEMIFQLRGNLNSSLEAEKTAVPRIESKMRELIELNNRRSEEFKDEVGDAVDEFFAHVDSGAQSLYSAIRPRILTNNCSLTQEKKVTKTTIGSCKEFSGRLRKNIQDIVDNECAVGLIPDISASAEEMELRSLRSPEALRAELQLMLQFPEPDVSKYDEFAWRFKFLFIELIAWAFGGVGGLALLSVLVMALGLIGSLLEDLFGANGEAGVGFFILCVFLVLNLGSFWAFFYLLNFISRRAQVPLTRAIDAATSQFRLRHSKVVDHICRDFTPRTEELDRLILERDARHHQVEHEFQRRLSIVGEILDDVRQLQS